eukprot:3594492-Prymnesium_polylepis.1
MHSSTICRAACDDLEAAEDRLGCTGWAALGQCVLCDDCAHNRTFMRAHCAAECARVERREACSASACAGGAALDDDARFSVVPELELPTVELWFRNEGDELVQLLYVDRVGTETAYGVLMPREQQPEGAPCPNPPHTPTLRRSCGTLCNR